MIKKQRHKPFYKEFLKIKQNIQNRKKIFKFKKIKWKIFQINSRKKLKFFKRFRLKDPYKYTVSKFTSKGNSFQRKFKNSLIEKKMFNLFYGGLKKRYLKKRLKIIYSSKKNKMSKFLNFKNYLFSYFESRFDTILYRSKFCLSVKNARQLIKHGHVLINKNVVITPSYIIKTSDLIEIAQEKKSRDLVKWYIHQSNFWPLPPKYLAVNYNTLQIIVLSRTSYSYLPNFTYKLNFNQT